MPGVPGGIRVSDIERQFDARVRFRAITPPPAERIGGRKNQYTYSKSIDDSALGGRGNTNYVIAQNWLDLSAERGLSSFDQRHVLNWQMQYTTGQGIAGGTLLNGWRGALFKEWTVFTTVTAGSGLPLTPVYLTAVSGTGVTGPFRPNYNGGNPLSLRPTRLPSRASGAKRDAIDYWSVAVHV